MTQKRKPDSAERPRPPAEDAPEVGDTTEVPIEVIQDEIQAQEEAEEARAAETIGETDETPELTPLEAAEARADQLEDRLRRLQAEFLNDTKRMKRQAQEDAKYAIERVVKDLLTVFVALHMARDGLQGGEGGAEAMAQGLDVLEKELLNVLGRHGVERMEAVGTSFDPSLHEALYVVEDEELGPNVVSRVLRPGFTLHGRVVRAAHVAVTKADEGPAADNDAGTDPGDGPGADEPDSTGD